MARSRSKSLVQSIASDGPHLNEHESNGSSEDDSVRDSSRPSVVRSKSFPMFNKSPKDLHLLHPFTESDFDKIWAGVLEKELFSGSVEYDFDRVNRINQLSQHEVQTFLKILNVNLSQLNHFQTDIDSLSIQLQDINLDYQAITSKTQNFNSKATELSKKEEDLNKKAESVSLILKNFENLDEITKKLSSPNNFRLIRSKSFKKILENLSSSLEFLNHSNDKVNSIYFKNIEIYKIKFRQCMTRYLTLVKDYLNNELRKLESLVNSNEDLVSISVYHEFESYIEKYNQEFYSFSNLIKIFIIRIEEKHELEYKGLLLEVLNNFFRIRLGLINYSGSLSKINSTELVKYTQDNLSVIKKSLNREFKLFKQLFGFEETPIPQFIYSQLYDFFKNLIDPFYDVIRQRILKESNISLLCQLTNLLQNYYEFEEDSYPDSNKDEINFGEVFQPILNDCQSRLIFRIQLYIDNKLVPYKPTPEDLNIGNKKSTKNTLEEEFSDNLFEDLYLPLGKALTILSNIYELINSVVFDDIAHYIVHSCIEILRTAAALCLKYSGKVDSKLFFLKNLIILKYQLNNFDIQFVRTETSLDFTSGLNELYNLIKNGEIMISLNQNGWFNLIRKTVPKVINNMMDAKLEVELEINNTINELLIEYLNVVIDPLTGPNTNEEQAIEGFKQFKVNVNEFMPKFKLQIINYLNDSNILRILFNNFIEILTNYYQNYYNSLQHANVDLNDIMEPEIFNVFFNNIVDELLNDDSLNNNLIDIQPLLNFDEELNQLVNEGETNVNDVTQSTSNNIDDAMNPPANINDGKSIYLNPNGDTSSPGEQSSRKSIDQTQ